MTPEDILAVGRVTERLLVCVCAGASLAFGWNLFRVGVVNQQSAVLQMKDWRVNLKSVGPGVFFALFGAAVLGISLNSPLSVTVKPTESNVKSPASVSTQDSVTYHYDEANFDPKTSKSWVASINTFQLIAKPEKFATPPERQAIARASEDLGHLRDALVIRQFGSDLFRGYDSYKKNMITDPAKVPTADKQRFSEIDEWMQGDRTLD